MSAQDYAQFWLPYAIGFAITNIILLLLLIGLVYVLWKTQAVQVATQEALTRQNAALLLTHLHEVYSRAAMHEAILTVINDPPAYFDGDRKRQRKRRLVWHFWEPMATIVEGELMSEKLLLDRFRDQISTWEYIKPLQEREVARIIQGKNPGMAAEDALRFAIVEVSTSGTARLYERWKDKRRNMWL